MILTDLLGRFEVEMKAHSLTHSLLYGRNVYNDIFLSQIISAGRINLSQRKLKIVEITDVCL